MVATSIDIADCSAWSRARAKRELTAWARSGGSMAEYARIHGLPVKRLWSWNQRLRKQGWVADPGTQGPVDAPAFAPVRVIQPGSGMGSVIAVVVGNGMSVRVPERFEADSLRRVLEVVRTCGPCPQV